MCQGFLVGTQIKNKNFEKLYTSTKEMTPDLIKSSVIYKIPYKECNKCYIGQIGR